MSLILPSSFAPSNLKLRSGVTVSGFIDGDLYRICERIKEADPSLFILQLADGHGATWAIMEHCADNVDRLVFKTDALDGRVIEKAARIKAVPFEQRLTEAEKEEADAHAARKEQELETLYEDLGRPMWSQLEHDGFIQRNRSYAKGGHYGKRR